MNRSFTEITEEALTLSQSEQLKLARALLENAEATGDVGSEAAWEEEIERRIQKIDAGLARGRPFPMCFETSTSASGDDADHA